MQTDDLEDQGRLDEAVKDLKQHFVELAGLIAERLKTGAREAIDETVVTAKKKAADLFSTEEVRSIVRSHPKAAVTSAFGLGAFIGMGKSSRVRSSVITLLGLSYELFRNSEYSGLRSHPNTEHPVKSSSGSIH